MLLFPFRRSDKGNFVKACSINTIRVPQPVIKLFTKIGDSFFLIQKPVASRAPRKNGKTLGSINKRSSDRQSF